METQIKISKSISNKDSLFVNTNWKEACKDYENFWDGIIFSLQGNELKYADGITYRGTNHETFQSLQLIERCRPSLCWVGMNWQKRNFYRTALMGGGNKNRKWHSGGGSDRIITSHGSCPNLAFTRQTLSLSINLCVQIDWH